MLYSRYFFAVASALAFFGSAVFSNAQVQANGYIDSSFSAACVAGSPGFVTRALLVQPDGRIIVGGQFDTPAACANGIVRLLTTGAKDNTFGSAFGNTDFV